MNIFADQRNSRARENVFAIFEAKADVPAGDFAYTQDLALVRRKQAPFRGSISKKVRFIVDTEYTALWAEHDMSGRKLDDPDWHEIWVERGYYTDFASVPWYGRMLISRVGPWVEASVVHDYLCDAWKWEGKNWSFARRRWADRLMLVSMLRANVGFRRYLIFGAISLFAYWQLIQFSFGFAPKFSRQKRDYVELQSDDEGGSDRNLTG